nr:sporulation protein YabP [Bacilli bacterium]
MNENLYKTQEIKIINRNTLSITGIKKITNFDNLEFILHSVLGDILVKGKNLEVLQLDTDKGDVKIKGTINSVSYTDS